jgi:lysophospholipase L1-like esterase
MVISLQRLRMRRKAWFRVLTVGMVMVVGWGIPEVIVRIANPPLEAFRAIAFGGDPNSDKLFMKHWRLHWQLRPNIETKFLGVTVRTNREGCRSDEPVAGRRVVLCLGDSTTFGWRVGQDEPFPAKLQALLNDGTKSPDNWEVINAGVPGYSSWQVRLVAEKLVQRWKPAVVVVCVGNNEAWPAERSDRQVDTARAVTGRMVAGLSASRFLVWASEKLRSEKPQAFIAPALDKAVPRVSREEFGENLRQIVRVARAANAKVVMLSPPVNLYFAPQRFQQFTGWEKWQAFYAEVMDLSKTGTPQQLLAKVDAAVEANPESFCALWIKGLVISDRDPAGGRELLEQAIEQHPFPENCKRSYRRVLAEVAAAEKTRFLDVNALLLERAVGPIPAALYLDWCHPTPQGHAFIAEALTGMLGDGKNH